MVASGRGVGLAAIMLVVLVAATAAGGTVAPAVAGEVCKKPVSAVGRQVRGEGNARTSAIAAWQRATARQYGRRFADYYYSGDRSFSCTWDPQGVTYRCGVTAMPCG